MDRRKRIYGKRRKRSFFKKKIKMYNGGGEEVMIDSSKLGEPYLDKDGNTARDHENEDVFYSKPPRFNQSKEMPVLPSDRIIENKPNIA